MKKLCTLLLAAGLLFSAVAPAGAVEVKLSGTMDFIWEVRNNLGDTLWAHTFMSGRDVAAQGEGVRPPYTSKRFHPKSRLILGAHFIASENLSAYYDAVLGYMTWGGPASGVSPQQNNGGALGSRAANLITRQAYLDWIIPSTSVKARMGHQMVWMPGFAGGNAAMACETGTGIVISAPVNDKLSLTGNWIRIASDPRRGAVSSTPGSFGTGNNGVHDTVDQFALLAHFRLNGWQFVPWAGIVAAGKGGLNWRTHADGSTWISSRLLPETAGIMAATGKNADRAIAGLKNSTMWWLGFNAEMSVFDPFRLGFDSAYGDNSMSGVYQRRGWYASARASYKTAYGTPALLGWYASGDDGNIHNGSERMPVVNGGFLGGADIFFGNPLGHIETNFENGVVSGLCGASAQWNNLSFRDDLFHSLHVTWIRGTNSPGMARYYGAGPNFIFSYLTERDSVVEVDFNSTYSIYKNLAAMIQFSYLFQNLDENLWTDAARFRGSIKPDKNIRFSDGWRLSLMMRYTF